MHIQKLINDKYNSGLATNTITKIRNILNGCLKQALLNDMIVKNPVDGVALPRHEAEEIVVFSFEEQQRFEEVAKKDNLYTLFILGFDTGLRIGELLALTWKDVNLNKGTVNIVKDVVRVKDYENESKAIQSILKVQDTPKSRASVREVPLTQRVISLLKKQKQKSKGTLVFSTKTGRYLDAKNVRRSLKRIAKKAQLEDCATHTMRHSYASQLFDLGVSPKVVSERVGHARVSITLDTYIKCNPSKKFEAVKVLDNLHSKADAL